ncbi:MAG: glycosyltransferase family 4 protein [Candidatus Eisenbacteria bacterium]
MRLAMVNTRMPGVNSFLIRDLRTLIQRGVVVDVYLFETKSLDPRFRAEVEAAGGQVVRVPFPGGMRELLATARHAVMSPWRFGASALLAIVTMLRSPAEGVRALGVLPTALAIGARMKADRVDQVHGLWAGVPGAVALWIHRHHGMPMSLSGHAWDLIGRTRLLAAKVEAARGMVVCSEFAHGVVARLVGASLARKVAVVHHGLNLAEWPFRGERSVGSPPLILAVGRLTAKKGFPFLIEAAARLRDRGLDFRVEIVGPDGGLETELRRLVAERRLEGHVRLVGEMAPSEVKARMAEADLLAMPSIQPDRGSSDGIPNVVLEAMALGTPVVSTDAGGIAEVVFPGRTGWLVAQRDPAGLADALEEALRERALAVRQAVAARVLVEAQFNAAELGQTFLRAIGMDSGHDDQKGRDENRVVAQSTR